MTNRIETISKLRMAQVSSCSCLTKTPDAAWHKEDCLYRVLTEAIAVVAVSHDLLEALINLKREIVLSDISNESIEKMYPFIVEAREAIAKALDQ